MPVNDGNGTEINLSSNTTPGLGYPVNDGNAAAIIAEAGATPNTGSAIPTNNKVLPDYFTEKWNPATEDGIYIELDRGVYSTAFSVLSQFPKTVDLEYFVDNVNGDDSTGDGTIGDPYASIQKAIDIAEAALPSNPNGGSVPYQTYRINVRKGNLLYRADDSFVNANPSHDMVLFDYDHVSPLITQAVATPTWTQQSAPNDDVWLATVSNAKLVADLTTQRDDGGYLRNGIDSAPQPASVQTSIANVQANANSMYITGSSVYVKTHDGREPDADVLVINGNSFFTTNSRGVKVFMYGFDFLGRRSGRFAGNVERSAAYLAKTAHRLSDLDESQVNSTNVGKTMRQDVIVVDSPGDGFGDNGTASEGNYLCKFFMEDCYAYECGTAGSTNDNLITGHYNAIFLRINCGGEKCDGPPLIDVLGAQSLNINCRPSDSNITTNVVQNTNFSCGSYAAWNAPSIMTVWGGYAEKCAHAVGVSTGGFLVFSDDVSYDVSNDFDYFMTFAEGEWFEPNLFFRKGNTNGARLYQFSNFDRDRAKDSGSSTIISWHSDGGRTVRARPNTSQRPPLPAVVSGRFNGKKVVTLADGDGFEMEVGDDLQELFLIWGTTDPAQATFGNNAQFLGNIDDTKVLRGVSGDNKLDLAGEGFGIDLIEVNGTDVTSTGIILPTGNTQVMRVTFSAAQAERWSWMSSNVSGNVVTNKNDCYLAGWLGFTRKLDAAAATFIYDQIKAQYGLTF